jgi:hypothetical protein
MITCLSFMEFRNIPLTKSAGKALLFFYVQYLVKFCSSLAGSTLCGSLITALPVWLNHDLSFNLCPVILSGCNMKLFYLAASLNSLF